MRTNQKRASAASRYDTSVHYQTPCGILTTSIWMTEDGSWAILMMRHVLWPDTGVFQEAVTENVLLVLD